MRSVAVVQVEFESAAESVFDAWLSPDCILKCFFWQCLRDKMSG